MHNNRSKKYSEGNLLLVSVQFQKISIPTPWKVNGNSEGVGGLNSQNFKQKVWGLSGNSRGVGGGGLNQKPSMGGVWIFYGTTHCGILGN